MDAGRLIVMDTESKSVIWHNARNYEMQKDKIESVPKSERWLWNALFIIKATSDVFHIRYLKYAPAVHRCRN